MSQKIERNDEVKRLREKLIESEWIREAFVNSSYDGYWDWNFKSDYEYMSPRFWEILGYDYREKKHHPSEWQKLVFPEDLTVAKKNLQKHIETRGEYPYSQNVRYKHKNGSTVTVLCRGKVVSWDDNGNPIRMIGTHTDLTELIQRDQKLQDQFAAYQRANKELEEYAFIASHDLQAPLRHIASYIDVLQDLLSDKLTEDELRIMGVIQNGCFKMKELINGLHELSTIGEHKIHRENVDLNEVLEQVVNEYKASNKLGELDVTYDGLPVIQADRYMMISAFDKLLDNSFKYKRDDVPLKVEVTASEVSGYWKIDFKDNGVGFTQENSEIIFHIFQKLYHKNTQPSRGLGLAIIKKIIECHKGKIEAESKPNEGATFHIYFQNNNRDILSKILDVDLK